MKMQVQSLAWETPYATGVALKAKNKQTKKLGNWSSHRGAVEMNLTRNHEVAGSIPGLPQGVKDPALL